MNLEVNNTMLNNALKQTLVTLLHLFRCENTHSKSVHHTLLLKNNGGKSKK